MNVIAAINIIYTRTTWSLMEDSSDPSELSNFGFSIEKVIVLTEPTEDKYNHYNNVNSSTNADTILEVNSHLITSQVRT